MGFLERRRVGRFARPNAGIINRKSIKVNDQSGLRGYGGTIGSKAKNVKFWWTH
jgi:hypothetical protein